MKKYCSLLAATLALTALTGMPLRTQAQAWPAKPITFIVPFAAGSATDQLARALGQSITVDTKQAVVVDTRPARAACWRRRAWPAPRPTATPC